MVLDKVIVLISGTYSSWSIYQAEIDTTSGGNGGIGFDTCAALASHSKYHVIMGSRSREKGDAAIAKLRGRKLPGSFSLVQLDITSDEFIDAAVSHVEDACGRLDILINNAGIEPPEGDLRTQMRETLEVNTTSQAVMSEKFAPLLKRGRNSKLVYVSSGMGGIGFKLGTQSKSRKTAFTPYRVSKAGLNMVMACYAVELEEYGVMTFAYDPGFVVTDL